MCSISFISESLNIGGRTWIDQWNQVMVNIFSCPITDKYLCCPIIYRTAKSHGRQRLIPLGLMAASTKADGIPNIDLSGERMLKMKLIKSRGKDCMLKIFKLSELELQQVRYVL